MNTGFPPPGLPSDSVIDVWRIDLDQAGASCAKLDVILSAEERGRAERLSYARGAERFRLCRAMLRLGLSWYLGNNPREVALTTGLHGKPRLAEASPLHFNVTHCDRLALIAFTTIGEVGIDVEAVDRRVESLDIANSNFTRKEAEAIAVAGSPEEQRKHFLRFWTRKEAVLKAAGGGLLYGLDSVDVSGEPPGVVDLGVGEGSRWLVRDLVGIDGYSAAIAAAPGDWKMGELRIDCDEAVVRFATHFPGLW